MMENTKTCELCLEQIIKTEDFKNSECPEKEILSIPKNLGITVSRNTKICSNCINISHLTYSFKTSCLTNNDYLKTLIRSGTNDKLILEEVIATKIKSEFENVARVCRFCLNYYEMNALVEINVEEDIVLKDMLGRCFSEIDTSIVQNSFICYVCSELLEKLFNFISHCEDTAVLRNLETKSESLVNENTAAVSPENDLDNIENSFVKKEEISEDIGNPEFEVRSEDSNTDCERKVCPYKAVSRTRLLTHQRKSGESRKPSRLYQCSECLFQSKYQSSLIRHKKNHKVTSESSKCSFSASNKRDIARHNRRCHKDRQQVKYTCDLCLHQTNQKSSLKLHYRVHQDLPESDMFKCYKCPFVTKWKGSLILHYKRWHEDVSNLHRYKCDECSYETIWSWGLVSHKITHRNPLDVKMYKCVECSHETKRKSSLQKHERMHARNRENVVKSDVKPKPSDKAKERKFVCDVCSYQTDKNSMLKRHYLIHKEPSEVNVFKCDCCPFATKWKKNLAVHAIRHRNPSELPKFKCNDCPYETNKRSNLVSHVLVHKHPSEVVMFKCKACSYQTKYRRCILVHEKKHEVEIYTCDECNYKTKFKSSFMGHVRYHKEWKQPANQNLKEVRQYKCNECSYVGTRKSNLVQHQLLHKDPSEREMYSCAECPFQALYKISLRRHYLKNHSDLEIPFGELKTFRCNECDYKTTRRRGILKHLQAHEQAKRTNKVNGGVQEKDSAQGKQGT